MDKSAPPMHPLKKVLVSLACILLCLLCGCTALVFSILMDVKHQVAALREQTAKVAEGLEQVRSVLAALDDPALARTAVAKGIARLPMDLPKPPAQNETARREIAHLLECIGRPDLNYEYEGKQRPAEWVQMKLNAKAVLLGGNPVSAEAFIDNVASRTHDGAVYYVIDKDGGRTELQAWLRERLREYRSH